MNQELIEHLRGVDYNTLIGEVINRYVDKAPDTLVRVLKIEMQDDEKGLLKVIGARGIELLRKATV